MEKLDINEIVQKIPAEWKELNKEEYIANGIRESEGMKVVGAYRLDDSVVSITSYEDSPNFIEEYNNQLNQIKDALKGKEWKSISTINPVINKQVTIEKVKLYFSVYEVYSTDQRVSLQVFFTKDYTMGFLTSIPKPEKYDVKQIFDKNKILQDIVKLLK